MNLQSGFTVREKSRHALVWMAAWAQVHWKWLTFLMWVVAVSWLIYSRWPAIHWLTLNDTDDNMRYLQVRDWLAGQGWYDLRQYRLDPPAGFNIHWSRLVDLPIAVPGVYGAGAG